MDTMNQTTNVHGNDLFDQQPKGLPGMLNVLTILTFIGCGLAYLGGIYNLYTTSQYESQMAQMQEAQDQIGDEGMAADMMKASIEMFEKTYEYRYIIFISTILFTTLCLIGALQMRKLKKSGFMLYTIGELAPIVLTAALIGFSLAGGLMIVFSSIIAVIFVILYATQRKYLVN
jgi:hypothetical protein